jgi:putative Holliday junction resolvase
MSKIFGLDYGKVRVGLASCSPLLKIPTPFPTFKMLPQLDKSAEALSLILKKELCSLLVVGLPLELSGKEGPMAQETKQFIEKLKTFLPDLDMVFLDERLTSAQAEKAMKAMDFSRKKRAQGSDSMAACLILETYLSKTMGS